MTDTKLLTVKELLLAVDTLRGEAIVYEFNGEHKDARLLRSAAEKLAAQLSA